MKGTLLYALGFGLGLIRYEVVERPFRRAIEDIEPGPIEPYANFCGIPWLPWESEDELREKVHRFVVGPPRGLPWPELRELPVEKALEAFRPHAPVTMSDDDFRRWHRGEHPE